MRTLARAGRMARRALLLSLLSGSLTTALFAQASAPADPNSTPAGTQESLGDIARKLRAEKANAAPPKYVINQDGLSRAVPAGFKQAAIGSGALTVAIPSEAIADEASATVSHFHVLLDNPKRVIMISFGAAGPVPAGANLASIPPMLEKSGMKVVQNEQQTIHGNQAIVIQLEMTSHGTTFREFQANVIARGQGYAVTCGTRLQDFPSVESTCRSVIESATVQ